MRKLTSNSKKTSLTELLVITFTLVFIVASIVTPLYTPSTTTTAKAATTFTATPTSMKPTFANKVNSILIGNKYDLNIKNKISGSTYRWTTSNTCIATVSGVGVVTGLEKGTVTITCRITTPKKQVYVLTITIMIRQPADGLEISNKITTVNVGQVYDFNRRLTPKSSNDATIWSSSNKNIATVDKMGVVSALQEGLVIITAKTLSGKTDKVTLNVVGEEGVVATQEELEALLGSGAQSITLKTEEEIDITIPKGDYKNQNLAVDAPNAKITNKGKFLTMKIVGMNGDNSLQNTSLGDASLGDTWTGCTWLEEAVGNTIRVTAAGNTRVVIAEEASLLIVISNDEAKVTIENHGIIDAIVIDSPSEVFISGTATKAIPVSANIAGAKITTSIPLELVTGEKISLTLQPGAESTKIAVDNKEVIPEIIGNGTFMVQVGPENNITYLPVVAVPQ